MAFLTRFKIGTRLGAGYAVVLLLLCAVGGFAVFQASNIYSGTLELADDWLPSVQSLGKIQALASDARRTTLRSVIASGPKDLAALRSEHDQDMVEIDATFASYAKLLSSPEESRLFDGMKAAWTEYAAADLKLLALVDAGDASATDARALANGESGVSFEKTLKLIKEDVELNRDGAVAAKAAAVANYHSAVLATSVLVLIALVSGCGIAVVITRSISAPISRAVAIAETVARGDLTARITVHGKDETSQLLGALGHMTEQLVDIVGRVRTSSESIATGSAQIASGNTDLSQRTEEQAASLEETAASMEQLTATVKQNAENALQGNTLAASASDTAVQGGVIVGRVVQTMLEISDSSRQVAQIIAVIEGIAFQTNILALNAAVEAARAGEQGRGFAVVAGEVRTLAQRSAAAAKEIKDLIGASVERVNNGSKLVDEAGRTMNDVVQSVKRVADLMGEISAASGEQHRGIEQVNQAVMQMDEATQQNAALVEEASAAAQSMAVQSDTLRELVSVFKLDARKLVASGVAPVRASAPRAAVRAAPAIPKTIAAARPVAPPAVAKEPDWQTF